MPSDGSNVSDMVISFNRWVAQLVPTSMEDRYFVANDELAACFFQHNSKWDTIDWRRELRGVLRNRHPSGIQPICTATWKKISCVFSPARMNAKY
jgi:hypothetical protein